MMKKALLTALCAVAACAGANADTVGMYSFTGSSLASSDTNPDSTASAITAGSAFITALPANTTYGNPTPALAINTTLTTAASSSQSGAVTANQYFSFTLTPNAGTPLNLSTLTFDYANSSTDGTFPTELFFVRSSADTFAANIAPSSVTAAAASNGAFATDTLSLSGAAFQNLTAPIEFRIYITDGTTQATRGAVIDNITVTNVPEPSTYALMIAGACLVGGVYRRRKALA